MVKDDDIVISGISGRFPSSDSIQEFKDNLFNGVDMVTADDSRWPIGKSLILFPFASSFNHYSFHILFSDVIRFSLSVSVIRNSPHSES